MPLSWFRAEQFRCLASVELELDPGTNIFQYEFGETHLRTLERWGPVRPSR